MTRLELSEQAKRIMEREREHIERESQAIWTNVSAPGAALSATCKLLNIRGRYFAVTGEHVSVQDYEGLCVIDALDELLLKALHARLKEYVSAEQRTPQTQAITIVAEKLSSAIREMPKYPVAYRLLYMLQKAFGSFEDVIDSNPGSNLQELESAFVHHILGMIDSYVQTRVKPGMRHFSDVAREYDVVSRMKCKCGADQFQVKLQSLMQLPDGTQYDRLDLECKACGHQRSITFDLPYFKDLYQV
jgi:hypothetical protein